MDSQVALVKALYSASVDDKETIGCFLLFHEMTPEPILNAYPEVDVLSSGFPTQSESE